MDKISITINSPFGSVIDLFDNEDTFPDLTFVIPGLEKPLELHRGILGQRSKLTKGLLKGKEVTKDEEANKIEWMFEMGNEADKLALVKALRFCYGEALKVDIQKGECCATIAALFRLQVTCLDEAMSQLVAFALEQTKHNTILGTKLLIETQSYPECCNVNTCDLDKELAKIVFTTKNICEHYEDVVDGCLMKLPMEYLDLTEYGEAHTMYSEFSLRTKYAKEHAQSLSREEKETLLGKCNWTKIQSGKLKILRELDMVGDALMKEACDKVLENTEKGKKEYTDLATRTETERDEARKKSKLKGCTH